ncbi:MAG: DUF4294 domain-containing protein [Bacteroidales bacterium]|jgi:hypothetical protein|nr:DUF4294 domain-containing protein [Bacteroidales bacterium]
MRFFLICFLIFVVVLAKKSVSQIDVKKDSVHVLSTIIIDGDTIPNVTLDEVVIFPRLVFKNKYRRRRYSKLIRDVKKAYPYAKYAQNMLGKMENEFQHLATENEKKKYIKTIEKQLMGEFGNELKKLTITQGRILLKLIDRETGDTSYELLKVLRGSVSAVFWQALARLFGSDLKSQYDPKGEDRLIERVVKLIEAGQIQLDPNVMERLKTSY